MSAESVDNLGSISLGCRLHLSVVFGMCCSVATVIAVVRRLWMSVFPSAVSPWSPQTALESETGPVPGLGFDLAGKIWYIWLFKCLRNSYITQAASNYFNLNLLLNHLTEFGTLYSFVLLLMGVREHIYVWCPALTNGAPQMVEGNPYSVSIMYLYKDKQYTVFFFGLFI